MNQNDYREAGLRVFPLYGVKNGMCECENPDCEALYKHPRASNWQHTPDWSDEQWDTMEMMGQFDTGFGVLVSGLLVVDVDARNGGVESFHRLCEDLKIDLLGECAFAVETGSGGGSMHLYFKAPDLSLMQHHEKYKGIDFKSSGFAVGAGSLHASGNAYEALHGHPDDISNAPDCLIKLLQRPEYHRAEFEGATLDLSDVDISEILSFYPNNNLEYDDWIACGMAIHDATNGAGFDLWLDWSATSDKHDPKAMEKKWHSFGKCTTPVKIGTLIHHAKANGYQSDFDQVTFTPEVTLDTASVDIKRPPGFVGELTQWINSQCLYPRESLAVAAAINAVGNICGLKQIDEMDGMTLNTFIFCVAGSSTGKEAVQSAYSKIMQTAGVQSAIHGAFKSEQEVIRNITRHQAAFYCIDELGITLKKIANAQAKGGASYLEGLIGLLMSAYGKAGSSLFVSGDVREEIGRDLTKQYKQCVEKVEANEDKTGRFAARAQSIEKQLASLDNGIERPFLSVMGFTTPVTFNDLIDFEQATNGFMSRALLFEERDDNPRRKKQFKKPPLPPGIEDALANMYRRGCSDEIDRIEHYGPMASIATTEDAQRLLDDVYQSFWDMAEQHSSETGLQAIPRRGYELVGKISAIMAAATGVRTAEHVLYSYTLVKNDIERKLMLAYGNSSEQEGKELDAITARVLSAIDDENGETFGKLRNKIRIKKKRVEAEQLSSAINVLVGRNLVKAKKEISGKTKKEIERFFKIG